MSATIITIGNLKGGVGKSTITNMFANYLFSQKKKDVLVIDADDYQQTIKNIRTSEMEENPSIKEEDLYHLIGSNSADVPNYINQLINDYDYIFIDLPGNIKQQGVSSCYMLTDIFIIPTSLSREDIDSTFLFAKYLFDEILPKRKKLDEESVVYGLLSKISKRGKEYQEFIESKNSLPIKFFQEAIVYSETFKRKTSSIQGTDHHSKTFNTKLIYEELDNILKIK